ncbi:hypothetical protein WG922_05955 [Ramlibacter sp. AN1015]|uniref:hypothetical protein n=1 Tax=Ramlibacter sp. AN1015 TaxID=3133428 RepID=UPI0030BAFA7B
MTSEPSLRPRQRPTWVLPALVALLVLAVAAGVALLLVRGWTPMREQAQPMLDPAEVVLVRTPGGLLEVATLERTESFGWSSRYTCPLIDCSKVLTPTISRVRVRAHYVYRVPLAEQWRLQWQGDRYVLSVPRPQLQEPVAFDTSTMELETPVKGWLSPPAAANRENVVRHLGPELNARGKQPHYLEAQAPAARKTVEEFARQWLGEQRIPLPHPLEVRFEAPPAQP